jgi:N-acetyl sugar amidotransferase
MRSCVFCVMDESDSEIIFDAHGQCNHCRNALSNFTPPPNGDSKISIAFEQIKNQKNNNSKYDCVVGLSGGVDSSYLLYLLKKHSLKPLVVHVDAGWNTIEAIENVQKLVKKFDFDLFTIVMNWKVMKDLHIAYLESGVVNQDVPQDHSFFVGLYEMARSEGIKCVIVGSNFASESILPASWGQSASDGKNLNGIYRAKYGKKLFNYSTKSLFWFTWNIEISRKLKVYRPLDLIKYDKDKAKSQLIENFGFQDYGNKHSESTFTSYFQKIYLPNRFGIDKRKAHLSSMIVSGLISREAAMEELHTPVCSESQERDLRRYVATKLGLSVEELIKYESMQLVNYKDYGYSKYGMFTLRIVQKLKIAFRKHKNG